MIIYQKFKTGLITTCLLLYFFSTYCQKTTISITRSRLNSESIFTFPVNASNFNYICAIGLKISYDTTKLKFINCDSINPKLTSAIYNAFSGLVAFAWASADGRTPVNIANGLLFNIRFRKLSSGSSVLSFVKGDTMVSDCDLNSKDLNFNNCKIEE